MRKGENPSSSSSTKRPQEGEEEANTPGPAGPPPSGRSHLEVCLERQAEDNSYHLMAFLDTHDILHLSECSKSTEKWRSYLTRVRIVQHPSPFADIMALLRLLQGQQLGISYLGLRCRWVINMIDVLIHGVREDGEEDGGRDHDAEEVEEEDKEEEEAKDSGITSIISLATTICLQPVLQGLTTLDLSMILLTRREAWYVGRALRLGGFPQLQALIFGHREPTDSQGLVPVMEALGRGSCPLLKRLDLCNVTMTRQDLLAFIAAIASGHLDRLESMDLTSAIPSDVLIIQLLDAIKQRPSIRLRHMNIADNEMSHVECRALAVAVHEGLFLTLEALVLSGVATDDTMLRPMVEVS